METRKIEKIVLASVIGIVGIGFLYVHFTNKRVSSKTVKDCKVSFKASSLQITAPSHEVHYLGQPVNISWKAQGGVGDVCVLLHDEENSIIVQYYCNSSQRFFVDHHLHLTVGKKYRATVSDTDNPEIFASSTWFIVKAPTITVTSPGQGSVYAGHPLVVSWEGQGFRGDPAIKVFDSDLEKHLYLRASASQNTVVLAEAAHLLNPGVEYQVVVSDSQNAEMTGASPWFCVKAPSLCITSPAQDAVVSAKPLTVTWKSEGLVGNVKLEFFDGTQQFFSHSCLNSLNTVELDLSHLLVPGKKYTLIASDSKFPGILALCFWSYTEEINHDL